MKKFSLYLASLALCSTLYADGYIGLTYGMASSDKTVYGNDSGEDQGPFLAYDDFTLTGISINGLKTITSQNHFLYGIGVDLYANDGDFLNGGVLDFNIKLGYGYNDAKLYGLVGYGIQSLSDYTVAGGLLYGAGIRYDILSHLSASVEYRIYNFETTENDDATAHQTYDLSGTFISVDFKF